MIDVVAIPVEVRPRVEFLTRKILPGALVVVTVAGVELEAEHGSQPEAEECAARVRAELEIAAPDRAHAICQDGVAVAIYPGPLGDQVARDLAGRALAGASATVRTVRLSREAPEVAAARRAESQDEALERMRLEVDAMIRRWVAEGACPGRVEAAQALAGFGLAKLAMAGVPFEQVAGSIGALWDTIGASATADGAAT